MIPSNSRVTGVIFSIGGVRHPAPHRAKNEAVCGLPLARVRCLAGAVIRLFGAGIFLFRVIVFGEQCIQPGEGGTPAGAYLLVNIRG